MRPHHRCFLSFGRFARITAFLVAFVTAGSGTSPHAPHAAPADQTSNPPAASGVSILETLGKAYAKDAGLQLDRLEVSQSADLGANRAEWKKRLSDALLVGYAPAENNRFDALPWSDLKTLMTLEMGKGRTPEQVLDHALASGSRVAQITWLFAGQKPVTSYAIFNHRGEILFDTLLIFPVIRIPLFEVGHF